MYTDGFLNVYYVFTYVLYMRSIYRWTMRLIHWKPMQYYMIILYYDRMRIIVLGPYIRVGPCTGNVLRPAPLYGTRHTHYTSCNFFFFLFFLGTKQNMNERDSCSAYLRRRRGPPCSSPPFSSRSPTWTFAGVAAAISPDTEWSLFPDSPGARSSCTPDIWDLVWYVLQDATKSCYMRIVWNRKIVITKVFLFEVDNLFGRSSHIIRYLLLSVLYENIIPV